MLKFYVILIDDPLAQIEVSSGNESYASEQEREEDEDISDACMKSLQLDEDAETPGKDAQEQTKELRKQESQRQDEERRREEARRRDEERQ